MGDSQWMSVSTFPPLGCERDNIQIRMKNTKYFGIGADFLFFFFLFLIFIWVGSHRKNEIQFFFDFSFLFFVFFNSIENLYMSDVRVSAVTKHLDSLDRLFYFFYSQNSLKLKCFSNVCCFVRLFPLHLTRRLACAFHVDDHISPLRCQCHVNGPQTPTDVSIQISRICKCPNFQKLRTMSHPKDNPLKIRKKNWYSFSFGGGGVCVCEGERFS